MSRTFPFRVVLGLAALAGMAGGLACALPSGILLPSDRPVEARIRSGQVHTYRIPLQDGELVRIVVEQRGADVFVTLRTPAGAAMLSADGLHGGQGREEVFGIADRAGEHRLEIRDADPPERSGSYVVALQEVRRATPRDRVRLAGAKCFERGEELRRRKTREGYEAAIPEYRKALGHFAAYGDREGVQQTRYALGRVHGELGEWRETIHYLSPLVPAWRGTPAEGFLLNWLGVAHLELGHHRPAVACFREVLRRSTAPGERATAFNGLARYHRIRGQLQHALDLFRQALRLWRQGDFYGRFQVLSNIGDMYLQLGRPDQALVTFEDALAMADAAGRIEQEIAVLRSLGGAHLLMGQYREAVAILQRSLELSQGSDPRTLGLLGVTAWRRGHLKAACAWQEWALEVAEWRARPLEIAEAQANLSYALALTGRPHQALPLQAKAEATYRQERDLFAQARVRYAKAFILRQSGALEVALAEVRAVLQMLEILRAAPASSDLRASFLAEQHDIYALQVEILLDLHRRSPFAGFAAAALVAAEDARARTLRESLAAQSTGPGLPRADPGLREREQRLVREAARIEQGEMERLAEGREVDERQLARLREVHQDLDAVRTAPRQEEPVRPAPFTVRTAQGLVDRDTLLLVYFLGRERSCLWLIGHDSLVSRELPGRRALEDLVRAVHDEWARPVQRGSKSVASPAARALSQALLGPVATELGRQRLLVVADRALHYLSFAALPDPLTPERPLLVAHEILYLPSVSALELLRREAAGRPRPRGEIAVFADPVFDRADRRLRNPVSSPAAAAPASADFNAALRSARSLGMDRLNRLPYAGQEARSILALATGRSYSALDFEATRAAITDPQLADYGTVHLATHGLFNPRFPALSGIVLSMVDPLGRPQDGFLTVADVYDLHLPVDLVVLSACQTALGEEMQGEGVLGLTRGFQHAGALRVMVSLWNVNDRATAELMKRFYHGLFRQRLPPAAALRQAQLSMLGTSEWRSPYHWAAFVLQGDWAGSSQSGLPGVYDEGTRRGNDGRALQEKEE